MTTIKCPPIKRSHNPFLCEMAQRFKQERSSSRALTEQTQKVHENVDYLHKLDSRLQRIIRQKKSELQKVLATRRRTLADLQEKQKLQELREKAWESNATIVKEIRSQLLKKHLKLETSRIKKRKLAQQFHKEKKLLKIKKQQRDRTQYNRRKELVLNVSHFEYKLKEKKQQRKEEKQKNLIKNLQISIKLLQKDREAKSQSKKKLQKKMRILTESTTRKESTLSQLESMIWEVKMNGCSKASQSEKRQCLRLHSSFADKGCARYSSPQMNKEDSLSHSKQVAQKGDSLSTNVGICK